MMKTKIWRVATFAILLISVTGSGCGPYKSYAPYGGIPTISEAPPSLATLPPYKLQIGDELEIKFYRNPELDQVVTIRPDGKISLPFIDEVMCAGKTPAELDAQITKRYVGELAIPDITVIVNAFAGQKVYVDGMVMKPGLVELVGTVTMTQAVAVAGGYNDRALREQVILIRKNEAGDYQGHSINMKDIQHGISPGNDVVLQSYDIVYVPRSKIANMNLWVEQYIRNMLPIHPGIAIPTT
jgi:protein involved in polysaccharide export with SLBB domain